MNKKQDDGVYFSQASNQKFCIEEYRFYYKRHDTILLNSVKALFILNGSACLALIAFFGQFIKINDDISKLDIIDSLLCFGIGCGASVACSLFIFFASYINVVRYNRFTFDKLKNTEINNWLVKTFEHIACIFGIGSLIFYFVGGYYLYSGLTF